jgi:hypothetical protein
MRTHIPRYIIIIAVLSHGLLCGNAYCCAIVFSAKNVATSLLHDDTREASISRYSPLTTHNSHQCNHSYHFCHCVQSPVPNGKTDFRVDLHKNLFPFPAANLSPVATTIPVPDLNLFTLETVGDSFILGVRLHLLLEHLLN